MTDLRFSFNAQALFSFSVLKTGWGRLGEAARPTRGELEVERAPLGSAAGGVGRISAPPLRVRICGGRAGARAASSGKRWPSLAPTGMFTFPDMSMRLSSAVLKCRSPQWEPIQEGEGPDNPSAPLLLFGCGCTTCGDAVCILEAPCIPPAPAEADMPLAACPEAAAAAVACAARSADCTIAFWACWAGSIGPGT
eukprot:scaffold273329_cov30-Tisochrysis_lutea.AAC.3